MDRKRGAPPGYYRLAAAQIDANPAFVHKGASLLEEPWPFDFPQSLPLHVLTDLASGSWKRRFEHLRQEVARIHNQVLSRRLQAILRWCGRLGVDLVAFPEYSIPAGLLPGLYEMSRALDITIVAGSHHVTGELRKSGVYEQLGLQPPPRGRSIAPVLLPDRVVLVPKLTSSQWEGNGISPGGDWHPIEWKDGLRFAVLICLDVLHEEDPKRAAAVTTNVLESVDFTVAAAATLPHSLPLFEARLKDKLTGYHRPTVFSNSALFGGSRLFARKFEGDENNRPVVLDKNEEGIVVADVAVERQFETTPSGYAHHAPVIWQASAQLLESGLLVGNMELQEFLESVESLDGLLDALDVPNWRQKLERWASERGIPRLTRRGLELFGQRLDRLTELDHSKALLRDVPLPEDAPSMTAVRARLLADSVREASAFVEQEPSVEARSQLDKLRSWRDTCVKGVLPGQEERVPSMELERRTLTAQEALPHYVARLAAARDEQSKQARALFQEHHFEEALREYERLLAEDETLALEDPQPQVRSRIAKYRLNAAACLLNLQRLEPARKRLYEVDPAALDSRAQAALAAALAAIGDNEKAEQIIGLVPPEASADEDVRAERQLVELHAGRIPPDLLDRSDIQAEAARALLEPGQLATAASHALRSLKASNGNPALEALALRMLYISLARSIEDEPPPREPIPSERRGDVLRSIEGSIEQLRRPEIPMTIRAGGEEIAAAFYNLILEPDRRENAIEWLAQQGHHERAAEDVGETIRRLAADSRWTEVEQRLDGLKPPWSGRILLAELLDRDGRRSEALDTLREAALRWPGRPHVEYHLALLLSLNRQTAEAVTHAQAAFEGLPCRQFRLLLVQCLLKLDRFEEAWTCLEPLEGDADPDVLRARAWAASGTSRLHLAEEALRRLIALRPQHIAWQIELAHILFQLGRDEDAAEQAWLAAERGKGTLSVNELSVCAQYQLLTGALSQERRGRVVQIAQWLDERFPEEPDAHLARLNLSTALGMPSDAPLPDLTLLLNARKVQLVPAEEFAEILRSQQQLLADAWTMYRSRRLTFEALCSMTGGQAAAFCSWIFTHWYKENVFFSTPVCIERPAPVMLQGRELLLGDQELLIFQEIGVLSHLRNLLGADGRLLLFQDVHARLVQDAAELVDRAQPAEFKKWTRLWELISETSKIRVEQSPPKEHSGQFEAEDLVGWLIRRGRLTKDKSIGQHVERARTDKSNIELPASLYLNSKLLHRLHVLEVLKDLLDSVPGEVVVDLQTWHWIRQQRQQFRDRAHASEIARDLIRWIGTGLQDNWIKLIPRPTVTGLPPSRNPGDPAAEPQRNVVEQALSWHEALVAHPNRYLVSADFHVGTSFSGTMPLEIGQTLAWTPASFEATKHRLQAVAPRILHVPHIVLSILPRPEGILERLAELGFQDAAQAEEILGLASRYPNGLAAGHPKELLDRIEWMARQPDLAVGVARVRLTTRYAEAIWWAWCDSKWGALDRTALGLELLTRAEALDTIAAGFVLDQLLLSLAGKAAEEPLASIVQKESTLFLSPEAPAGQLWRFLAQWAGPEGRRRAAFNRALRDLLFLLEEHDKTSEGRLRALWLAAQVVEPAAGDPFRPSSLQEAFAILSANWNFKPMRERGLVVHDARTKETRSLSSLESTLQSIADRTGREREGEVDADGFSFRQALRKQGTELPELRVPVEAIVLRMQPKAVPHFTRWLSDWQGRHDGRLYKLLNKLAKTPKDQKLRRKYARTSVTSPARQVREDVRWITTWGHPGYVQLSVPRDVESLRQFLSEPGPLTGGNLMEQLAKRWQPGGFWNGRTYTRDWEFLEILAVPGRMSLWLAMQMIRQDKPKRDELIADALERLDRHLDHSAGRLAADVALLRVCASREPIFRYDGQERDLRELLPARLEKLLSAAAPPPESLAATEPAILRLCSQTVQHLSIGSETTVQDRLWLTYRLYQWLLSELELLSPERRIMALQALSFLDPGLLPLERCIPDALDPGRFGRDQFDVRLAAILYALLAKDELSRPLGGAEPDTLGVLSEPLAERLAELAARPLTKYEHSIRELRGDASVLGWGSAATVPDLALGLLIQVDPKGFSRLPEQSRLRWLEELPQVGTASEHRVWVIHLLLGASFALERLTRAEQTLLRERILALLPSEAYAEFLLVGLIVLYGNGQTDLHETTRGLLLRNIQRPTAPSAFSSYLLAVAEQHPDRFRSETETVLEAVQAQGLNPIDFALAVGAVAVAGQEMTELRRKSVDSARSLLAELALRSPYRDDERLQNLVSLLGIS